MKKKELIDMTQVRVGLEVEMIVPSLNPYLLSRSDYSDSDVPNSDIEGVRIERDGSLPTDRGLEVKTSGELNAVSAVDTMHRALQKIIAATPASNIDEEGRERQSAFLFARDGKYCGTHVTVDLNTAMLACGVSNPQRTVLMEALHLVVMRRLSSLYSLNGNDRILRAYGAFKGFNAITVDVGSKPIVLWKSSMNAFEFRMFSGTQKREKLVLFVHETLRIMAESLLLSQRLHRMSIGSRLDYALNQNGNITQVRSGLSLRGTRKLRKQLSDMASLYIRDVLNRAVPKSTLEITLPHP